MKLNQLTISQAQIGLKTKKFTSHQLVQACFDQIQATNSVLNSFLTLNPKALKEADSADKLIQSDPHIFKTKPLIGIPYALKDNFLSKGIRTTASSKVLDNYVPTHDATVVARLRHAGAIILGKTNMDAWAHGSSTETSDYGTSKNPWNIKHSPGGSSGGSAAAVSAHQCIFAIGSETAGSVRGPAAWCGITGFKPTYGRVPRYGVVAMASSTDSPGPLTKNIEDALTITKIIAGPDPYDATTIPDTWSVESSDIASNIKGAKIGVPREYLLKELPQKVRAAIDTAIKVFSSLGAQVEQTSLMDPKYAIGVYTIIQRSEVSSNLARYDGVRYGNNRSFFGSEAKRRIMLGTYSLSSGYYDQYYNKAQKVRTLIVQDYNRAFSKYDVLIGPTMPSAALKIGASEDQAMFGELADVLVEASSIAGLTGLSIPCGFDHGLPVGLQITGRQRAETKVLQVGLAYQQATDWHTKQPPILNS